MGGVMRQSAGSIGRPVVVLAAIIALCCLSGCEAIHELNNLDDIDDNPMPKNRDDDNLLSGLQLYLPTNGHVQGRDGDTVSMPGFPVLPRQHNG